MATQVFEFPAQRFGDSDKKKLCQHPQTRDGKIQTPE